MLTRYFVASLLFFAAAVLGFTAVVVLVWQRRMRATMAPAVPRTFTLLTWLAVALCLIGSALLLLRP